MANSRRPNRAASNPRDNAAYRFPVSVKGVVIRRGRVILLKNERNEWELPGGKLEPHETPESCVAREVTEELELHVEARRLLDSWIYTIAPGVHVLILTYGCTERRECVAVLGDEHRECEWFSIEDVDALEMPRGYKASIKRWAREVSEGRTLGLYESSMDAGIGGELRQQGGVAPIEDPGSRHGNG